MSETMRVTKLLLQRYAVIMEHFSDLQFYNMNENCKRAMDEDISIDKLSRWLGFIQGLLVSYDLVSLEEEMIISKQLFDKAYQIDNDI